MARWGASFERGVRALGQAAFRRVFGRNRPPPSDVGVVARILLVRTDKIGDAVVSTPVFEALRKRYAGAEIDVLLGARNGAVAPLLPFVDTVWNAGKGVAAVLSMLRRLRGRRYDLAIDLLAADSISAALYTIGSGAKVKIGFEDSTSAFYDFPIARPPEPSPFVPKLLKLLAPLNITVPSETARPSVRLSAEALNVARAASAVWGPRRRGLLAINISASSPQKFWGEDAFFSLTRTLAARDFTVLPMGAPRDEAVLREIAERAGVACVPPRQSLSEFAAVLSLVDLVISPDTSIIHIAAALGKPVVALFGTPYTAAQWTPWGVPSRALFSASGVRGITCDAILAAVEDVARETFPIRAAE